MVESYNFLVFVATAANIKAFLMQDKETVLPLPFKHKNLALFSNWFSGLGWGVGGGGGPYEHSCSQVFLKSSALESSKLIMLVGAEIMVVQALGTTM